jgi:hypothetical protein
VRSSKLLTTVAVAAGAFALAQTAAGAPGAIRPVPSLTPGRTARLWHALVARRHADARGAAAVADCRPARLVFYAATDWLRLATTLAQDASPCAQYFVSIPPLTSDKTQPRPRQAGLIRALGPNMHALAEISYAAWSRWVQSTGSDWFTAGVTARQRMATAGYDVAAGDTWALNEVSSAVRRDTGAARSNLAEFLRGLEDGGGNPARGVVFVIGVGQPGDQTAYRIALQGWLQDSTFWSTISQYVSDWLQEDYGDVRSYAVAGASAQQRRDALVQYLGHPLALANAGGAASAAARTFLVSAYGPLANAAWAWTSSYGWTAVPSAQMEDFVSAQTYAARALDAESGFPADRFGFGWAPVNTVGLTSADFAAQTAAILARLAQAIHDSGETVDPNDPGVGACGPAGQNLWCSTVLPGAAFNTAWAAFSTWTQPGVAFANAPVTMTAGTTAGPFTVQLQTSGVVTPATAPQTVTLSTTSAHGAFSTSAAGPWTPTLTLTIPAGASSASFSYQDTTAGTPTLSALLPGQPPATQTVTVVAAAPATLAVAPRAATVTGGRTQLFSASVADAYGNPSSAPVAWALSVPALGSLAPVNGAATTFTASVTAAGRGRVTATVGSLHAAATLAVVRPPARIGGTLTRRVHGHVVVTVWVVRGSARARGVLVSVTVRRGSSLVARVAARTDARGRVVWRSRRPLPAGRYAVKAAIRSRSTR